MDSDEFRKLVEFIAENSLMTIATAKNNQPWAATVFFSYDNNLNLYFLSNNRTRHALEIAVNAKVAVTINKEVLKPSFLKCVQLEGDTQLVKSPQELIHAFTLYEKRFPETGRYVSTSDMFIDKVFETRIYRVKPKIIWFLDEVSFGSGMRLRFNLDTNEVSKEKLPGV